jgi:hypothetical protein
MSAARKKYDSEDIDVESMSTEELARHTALNVYWMRQGQSEIKDQIAKLVPEEVCRARTKAITAELRAASDGAIAKVHSEVAKQIPPAGKEAVAETTGMHNLTKLLERAERRSPTGEHPVQQSGLGWARSNPKTALTVLVTVIGLFGSVVVKGAYFIVDMDQRSQAREMKTTAALKKVEKKIEPPKREIRYKYIRVMVPVAPDSGMRRRVRPRRRPRASATP